MSRLYTDGEPCASLVVVTAVVASLINLFSKPLLRVLGVLGGKFFRTNPRAALAMIMPLTIGAPHVHLRR